MKIEYTMDVLAGLQIKVWKNGRKCDLFPMPGEKSDWDGHIKFFDGGQDIRGSEYIEIIIEIKNGIITSGSQHHVIKQYGGGKIFKIKDEEKSLDEAQATETFLSILPYIKEKVVDKKVSFQNL